MDTSAWIEVLRGSQIGEQVKEYLWPQIIEDGRDIVDIITPSLVIMEMRSKYIRKGEEENFSKDLAKIRQIGNIEKVNIDENLAIKAGEKHGQEHARDTRISYNDCILMRLAEKMNMKVISTDKHFAEFTYAIYIKKEGYNEN